MSQPPHGSGPDHEEPRGQGQGPGPEHSGQSGQYPQGGGSSPAYPQRPDEAGPDPYGWPGGPHYGGRPGAAGPQTYPGQAGAPPPGGGPPGAGPSYLSQFDQGGFADQAVGGFFGALFDLSFTKFATPYILRFVFILAMVVIGLAVVMAFLGGLISLFNGDPVGLVFVILAPLGGLLYLLVVRLALEAAIAVIRVAQNSARIVEQLDRR